MTRSSGNDSPTAPRPRGRPRLQAWGPVSPERQQQPRSARDPGPPYPRQAGFRAGPAVHHQTGARLAHGANATPAPAGESLKEPPDGVTYPGGGGVPGGRAGWGHLARPARTHGLEAFALLLHSLKLNQLQVAEQSAHGGEIPNRPLRPAPGSAKEAACRPAARARTWRDPGSVPGCKGFWEGELPPSRRWGLKEPCWLSISCIINRPQTWRPKGTAFLLISHSFLAWGTRSGGPL